MIAAERDRGPVQGLVADEDDVAIAAVTAAELLVGVEMADARHHGERRAFVEDILAALTIEDYDLDVARIHAGLLAVSRKTGRSRGAHDLIIAATAAARGREVVTADPGGFLGLPGVTVR